MAPQTRTLKIEQLFSSFSVNDIEKAKRFYGETLGLDVEDGGMGTLNVRLHGGGHIMIYPKGDTHAPASFTIMNIPVDDIDAAAAELNKKGIQLLRYTGELETDQKGIFRGAEKKEGPNIAWFTDPAGNILSIIEEETNGLD